MSGIKVKFDPAPPDSQIHQDITMPLMNPGYGDDPAGDVDQNRADIDQTLVYGIRCPIISIEGFVVSWEDILNFELHDDEHLPTMSCKIFDSKNFIQQLMPPGQGHTHITTQIIPPHDKYKKIDLHFIMTDYSVDKNNIIYISATYDLPDFTAINFKSLGELKLFELYTNLAKELKLGFATNTEEKDDKRFVFCNYTSYENLLEQQTNNSGEEKVIYNWWIDPWHYLVLENIYERYNSLDNLDNEPEQWIWIINQINDMTAGIEYTPYYAKPEFSNMFGYENSQLFVKDYRILNDVGTDLTYGTDKVYSVYSMKEKSYKDTLFIDSSVKAPIKNFVYKGEVYGEYDYITNSLYHVPFYQKMNKEIIEIDLPSPLLALPRGKQVLLSIYKNDDDWDDTRVQLEKQGSLTPYTSIEPVGNPMDFVKTDKESQEQHNHFKLDKTISTQYLVIGNIYKYKNGEWTHTVKLVRPDDRKIDL